MTPAAPPGDRPCHRTSPRPRTPRQAAGRPRRPGAARIVQRIADLRAWLFLAALIIVFEAWARVAFGGTFVAQHLQPPVDRDLRGGAAAAGDGADLRHHLGRHRPVAGLHHGPRGGGRRPRRSTRHAAGAGLLVGGAARASSSGVLIACIPGVDQRPAGLAPQGAALHRHARHVRRGARRRLPARRRHDRAGQQLVLRASSATAGSSACPISCIITARLRAGHALPAEPDPLRPAQLRHRRQHAGRAPRRHRHQAPPPPALRAVGGLRRPRRRALRRPLQRRRRAGGRAAAPRLRRGGGHRRRQPVRRLGHHPRHRRRRASSSR